MYYQDSMDAGRQLGLSRTAADVWTKLQKLMWASQQNGKPYVYISNQTMADIVGRSKRTVQRAVRELKDAGLIRVERTRSNGHTYIEQQPVSVENGASRSVKNGASNTKGRANNIDIPYPSISVKPQQTQMTLAEVHDDGERISSQISENVQEQPVMDSKTEAKTANKGRPTPKRPRVTKAQRLEKRQQIMAALSQQWKLGDERYQTYNELDEFEAVSTLAGMVADAVSVPSARIAASGRFLTGEEYWSTVKQIRPQGLFDVLERIQKAQTGAGVRNLRAYTLAALYNHAQWERLAAPLTAVV